MMGAAWIHTAAAAAPGVSFKEMPCTTRAIKGVECASDYQRITVLVFLIFFLFFLLFLFLVIVDSH